MDIKFFIGKTVIESESKKRYILKEITSPFITVVSEKPNEKGYRDTYVYGTINGNPIKNGTLVFEDTTLTEPFMVAYSAYCRTRDAYWEEYGYWSRRD